MLALTRKTDYALVALSRMARSNAPLISARDLASQLGAPLPILTNVLNQLAREGVLVSVRGARGGYKLANAPAEVSVLEIIETVEGRIQLTRCCEDLEDGAEQFQCDLGDNCDIQTPIRKLQDVIRGFLGKVSLHDFAWDSVSLTVCRDVLGNDSQMGGKNDTTIDVKSSALEAG